MRLRAKIIVLALLFCLLFYCVPEARVSIVGGLTYEKNAESGETYRGAIIITNSGDEPQEVKVYQTDYLFFSDGNNIYGEPGKDPRSNAKWITFSPNRFVIQPKGKFEVNYTVKAPDNKALLGTYWSMLMVEGVPKSSPEIVNGEVDKIKMGLTTVVRYGIQMVTHIGNTGTRSLKFSEVKLLKEDESKKVLQVDMENTGERWLRPTLWTEIYDEKGSYIGKFMGGKGRTYPGTSIKSRIDLSQVPAGKYKGLIVADCGGDDLFGMQCNLEIGE